MGRGAGHQGMNNHRKDRAEQGDKLLITRRGWLKGISGMLVVPAFALSLKSNRSLADDFAEGARAFVQAMIDSAMTELTDPNIDRAKRKDRMRGLMQKYFFVPGIAQWVLGRFWRRASKTEKAEFLELFESLIVETYVDRFANYNGETLRISQTDVRGEGDAIVSSVLRHSEGNKNIRLDWRVRSLNGTYKIIDIMVEGVSMGQTQRAQFASSIKSSKNDMGEFLAKLRDRVSIRHPVHDNS